MTGEHISVKAIAQALTARMNEEQLLELLEVISCLRYDGWCAICGATEVPLDTHGHVLPSADEDKASAFRDDHTEDCLATFIERHIYFGRARDERSYCPLSASPEEQARETGQGYGMRDWTGNHTRSDDDLQVCVHRALRLQRTLNASIVPIELETHFIEGHLEGYRAAQEIERQILAARHVRQVR